MHTEYIIEGEHNRNELYKTAEFELRMYRSKP